MHDREVILEYIAEVQEAIRRIERRFSGIESADAFVESDDGLDRLDGIAMMLIAIGENIKKIDTKTKGTLLERFPSIPWPSVKGTRDILAHDYFGIDHEEIYSICINDLEPLKQAITNMHASI